MRPDKKKVRHHDSRKSEAKAKSKQAAVAAKKPNSSSSARESPAREVSDSEDDAGEKEEEAESRFGKRNVSSNWTKYEIPSSGDEGEESAMTGEDYNDVLQAASESVPPMKTVPEDVNRWFYVLRRLGDAFPAEGREGVGREADHVRQRVLLVRPAGAGGGRGHRAALRSAGPGGRRHWGE